VAAWTFNFPARELLFALQVLLAAGAFKFYVIHSLLVWNCIF
jgi:hypothetical protein